VAGQRQGHVAEDDVGAADISAIPGAPGELARSSRCETGTGKEVAFRLVASVARVPSVTAAAKRTQRSSGVG
jgi:hypothetical protein